MELLVQLDSLKVDDDNSRLCNKSKAQLRAEANLNKLQNDCAVLKS